MQRPADMTLRAFAIESVSLFEGVRIYRHRRVQQIFIHGDPNQILRHQFARGNALLLHGGSHFRDGRFDDVEFLCSVVLSVEKRRRKRQKQKSSIHWSLFYRRPAEGTGWQKIAPKYPAFAPAGQPDRTPESVIISVDSEPRCSPGCDRAACNRARSPRRSDPEFRSTGNPPALERFSGPSGQAACRSRATAASVPQASSAEIAS